MDALPQPTRVLHVDDDPEFAELTATFLKRDDDRFSVETATDAGEALDRISDDPPDCIVSDYNMPGMGGIEFLRAVREEHPELPFILYTGKGSEAVASDAISAGVTDYLRKRTGPEQYELLGNRIRNAVRARTEAERAARQEELMRLTELAGDAGGFELDHDTGEILLTDGASRLTGLSADQHSLSDVLGLHPPEEREQVRTALERVAETGEQVSGTWRLQPPDSEERLLDITIVPATNGANEATLRGAVHDVTIRTRRQRELEQVETLFEHAQDSLFLVGVDDEEFTIERVNTAYEAATGMSADRLCGQTLQETLGEQQGADIAERYRECVERREPVQYDMQLRLGGTTMDWETRIAPVVLDGTVEYIAGSTRDVTDERTRERELAAERRFVQQALDTLDDLFYVLDTDGTCRRWNEQFSDITGYTDEELATMHGLGIFPADEHERIEAAFGAAMAGERTTVEADLQTADGERLPYEFTGARLTDGDGETTGVVGIGRDLTERRHRERRFQALVEGSNDIISVVDAEGRYTYQSPSLERILGYDPEEIVGDEAWEYIHPDDREAVRETFAEWVANPDVTGVIRYRARDADGCWRWMEARGNNQLNNPAIEGYVVNSRDITEQRNREQELRTVTRQYQTLLEQFPDGAVYLFDDNLEFVRARGAELRAVGLSPEAVEGTTPQELFPADIADELVDGFRAVLSGEERTLEQEYQGEHYRIRTVPVDTSDSDGDTVEYGMAVAKNVTEQTNRRRQLRRQNERLEEFASIVSHDLRNPLQVARGRVELARETGDTSHLSNALDAFDRSEALIENLLTLAHGGDPAEDTERVRLDSLAEHAWSTVETGTATLETDTDRVVSANRSRLRQLFENLFGNAVKHVGQDVTVTVAALDNGFSVVDDGPGIPPAERDTVFDAGYSTNDRGTGFGLRIVEEVVDEHDWVLRLTESTDGGARFEITGVDTAE
ncbi:MAG: PAS sensor histidine kinase [halophilic archaeon J07HX64]|jgi:PAS domain S-box|nr:MAG: PAS sensor histidine kinase [halophilic archaeon J07HX64]